VLLHRKKAKKGAKKKEFSYQIVRETMKGKERLEMVTKTVFSLSLSTFCITKSSSEKYNFASKKTMKKEKFKLLFYLKRGTQDKNGKSPIMGRISIGRSMVQFSCKCACTQSFGIVVNSDLWERVPKPYQ
jgi:hypothetical protein